AAPVLMSQPDSTSLLMPLPMPHWKEVSAAARSGLLTSPQLKDGTSRPSSASRVGRDVRRTLLFMGRTPHETPGATPPPCPRGADGSRHLSRPVTAPADLL